MRQISDPIIYDITYNEDALDSFEKEIKGTDTVKLILSYPTVYMVQHQPHNHSKKSYLKDKYSIYIGETSDILNRIKQHMQRDANFRDDWKLLNDSKNSSMYVIGHELFNKSLTLDIENRLMLYMLGNNYVDKIYNRRTNQQNEYYTSDKFEEVFSKIWKKLHTKNKKLFPVESVIKDSALFKASPFHKLSDKRNWRQFHTEKDLAISISLEASELLELFQWKDSEEVKNNNLKPLKEELADVLIYSIMLADNLGLDMKEIVESKLEINDQKYPVNK